MAIEQHVPGELVIHGRRFKGVVYPLDGKEVELYRVGALAAALEKTPQQVAEWERDGLFPKPFYRISGGGHGHCKRWYSREQIINIRKVWKTFPLRKGAARHKDNFFKTVLAVYYKTNIVTINVTKVPKDAGQKESPRKESHSDAGATAATAKASAANQASSK